MSLSAAKSFSTEPGSTDSRGASRPRTTISGAREHEASTIDRWIRAEPLDDRRLRDAFGRFATGVAFVTADAGDTPLGLIVSSFAAVSMEPPLVSFCPARTSLTWRRMREARRFEIHVLATWHGEFARRAATPGADRFAEPLEDALAVIECDLEAEHPAGDHSIVVGRVRRLQLSADPRPLVYFAGGFGAFKAH